MKTTTGLRLAASALAVLVWAEADAADDCLNLDKEVDRRFASPADDLTYVVEVSNVCYPGTAIGLFTDDFPGAVANCVWTCSATGSGGCELASGTGAIQQLLSAPIGTTVTIDATCTFAPSPGDECAVNAAEFFTMDPDILIQDVAVTCDWDIILFFADFESGNTSSWSETFP